jgi:hypothetical protein
VDFFDFIPFDPFGSGPSRAESPEEAAAQVGAMLLLPVVYLCVVLSAGLTFSGTLTLVVVPLVFASLAYLLCRVVGAGVAFALGHAFYCAMICGFVGLCAILLSTPLLPFF